MNAANPLTTTLIRPIKIDTELSFASMVFPFLLIAFVYAINYQKSKKINVTIPCLIFLFQNLAEGTEGICVPQAHGFQVHSRDQGVGSRSDRT